ncbi:MAG: beta-glucuronidase LacZ4 [Phocaeicola sp.]
MKTKLIFTLMLLFSVTMQIQAERIELVMNNDWRFRFSHEVEHTTRRVDLPHTWNTVDALAGKRDYKRGIGNYSKRIWINQNWEGKRLFLKFEGANSVADLFINGKHTGTHKGGYTAFTFEITDKVNYGKENTILVRVNNAENLEIMPLVGDFNFYGGIYRDVKLMVTEEACISPLDYGSCGVYLVQEEVSKEKAVVNTKVNISNRAAQKELTINVKVKEGTKIIASTQKVIQAEENKNETFELPLEISKPRLWNGVADPFIYTTEITLSQNGTTIDQIAQPLGLRFYTTDPAKGFFLNGEHLQLRGVCRHQDRAEVGNMLTRAHHEEDINLIREMGANALRLSHYPHAQEVYDILNERGIVVWCEIPFVGPGGYDDKGFVDSEAFKANGREQLKEMIRQYYNHPSILFWGIFNELKEEGDNPVEYVKELNLLAQQEDKTRPTVAASNQGGALNYITENIAWNRYDGWYGGMPEQLGQFLDATHKKSPELRIGVSEYGAGASIYHQQDSLTKTVPVSWWHPENWQTFYHMENWKIINERPYIWGSFVWNMFDFGAAHRIEGDRYGVNDKGLVTYDRRTPKDAFYFYKANWNKEEPMLYIAERRIVKRSHPEQRILVFTNLPEAELFINGKSMGIGKADQYATIVWENLTFEEGNNQIEVKATTKSKKKGAITDQIEVEFQSVLVKN